MRLKLFSARACHAGQVCPDYCMHADVQTFLRRLWTPLVPHMGRLGSCCWALWSTLGITGWPEAASCGGPTSTAQGWEAAGSAPITNALCSSFLLAWNMSFMGRHPSCWVDHPPPASSTLCTGTSQVRTSLYASAVQGFGRCRAAALLHACLNGRHAPMQQVGQGRRHACFLAVILLRARGQAAQWGCCCLSSALEQPTAGMWDTEDWTT